MPCVGIEDSIGHFLASLGVGTKRHKRIGLKETTGNTEKEISGRVGFIYLFMYLGILMGGRFTNKILVGL